MNGTAVPALRDDSLYDNRPVRELPVGYAETVVEMVALGLLEVIAKDPETRSVRLRLTPLGEDVVEALRAGKLVTLEPGPDVPEEER